MIVAATGLITKHTPERERIYRALLAEPTREWTARGLWEHLPTDAGISADLVRSTLYVLQGRKAVRQVFGHRVMTFRLTVEGETALRGILRDWNAPRHPPHRASDGDSQVDAADPATPPRYRGRAGHPIG